MSEGKLSSNDSGGDDKQQDESPKGPAPRLGGRFRAPSSSAVDLPAYTPDDGDEVVDEVAKRFRSGPRLGGPAIDDQESLDQKAGGGDDEKADAGSVLDALDPPEPNMSESTEAMEAQKPTSGGPMPATDRLDTEEVDEIPVVDIEPLSDVESDAGSEGGREIVCPSCHAENPAGMSFCVECGGSLEVEQSGSQKRETSGSVNPMVDVDRDPPPPTEAAREENPWDVEMVCINEDGSDGKAISLDFLETTVGRDGDERFPTDAFLSPKHARFHVEEGKLFIEDLYSLNGTFIKLRDETRLTPGDTILMGRQVLRYERFEQSITPKTKSSDGTRYMGSPAPGGNYKILQIGIGGVVQNVYCLPEAGAVLGREKGDIVFPHDKFMSGRHAQIYAGDDGHCYLVDLNSSNGTWIKIWEKTELEDQDYIFMGQQLFRVHLDQ